MNDVSVPGWYVSDGLGLELGHSLTHSLTHSTVYEEHTGTGIQVFINNNEVSNCSFSFEYSNTVLHIEEYSTVVVS